MDPGQANRLMIILTAEAPVAVGIYLLGTSQGWPLWLITLLCVLMGLGVGEATSRWFWRG